MTQQLGDAQPNRVPVRSWIEDFLFVAPDTRAEPL